MAAQCTTQIVKFKLRRGAAADWANPCPGVILAAGEPGYETDTHKLKIGDGITPWCSLPYIQNTSAPTGPTGVFDGGTACYSSTPYTSGVPVIDLGLGCV
jgi:hypothetical protein